MMKRSIVTTCVSDSTQRVHLEGDVARLISTPDTDAAALEPRYHFGGRMPVVVARTHTDHRVRRLQLVEPLVARGGARAVMSDLEQRHGPDAALEPPLHRQSGVGLEEHPSPAVGDDQHDTMLVHVDRP